MNISEWASNNVVLLIDHGVTIVSIVFGIWIVMWRLGRQHQNSLKLQKDNARAELKLQIYERLTDRIRDLMHKGQKATSYVGMLPVTIESHQEMAQEGLSPSPVSERAPVFSQLNHEASCKNI